MSNNDRPDVQQPRDGRPQAARHRADDRTHEREHEPEDARVERSVAAVRQAMGELLFEQRFEDITVQRILDRAGVARATFYAHYRNKDDALYASFEGMLSRFESQIDGPSRPRGRLVPVAELLQHFADAGPVFTTLRDSGRMDGIWSLGTDLVAALIERRASATGITRDDLRLQARMLAGACMEMMRWWMEQPQPPIPDRLDAQFHAMAARVIGRGAATRGP